MTIYHVQSILRYNSGLPEDVAVNNFYLDCQHNDDPLYETDIDVAIGAVAEFWNSPLPSTRTMGTYISGYVARTDGLRIKVYDPSDAPPRAPLADETLNLVGVPGNATSLPLEVSVVSSFQATRASGLNQARRRGRIFIGPLNMSAIQGSAGQATYVADAMIDDLEDAAARLARRAGGLNQASWVQHVYSRSNNNFVAVTSGWIDNDPDTQRRRGIRPTERREWAVPAPA